MADLRVLALIPAHDEGPRIRGIVDGAKLHLPVLVVDDGSADDTAVQAEAAGAELIRQRPNRGKGAALRAGFRRALAEGVDAVVTLDGDGQHDPSEIPRFLAAFGSGTGAGTGAGARAAAGRDPSARPELIIGRRNFRAMPPARRLANELGRRAFSWAVGQDVPDNQSGYRLVGRRVMEAMLASEEAGFEFEVEMITTCLRNGWPLAWVPIRTIYGAPSHIRPAHHLRHFLRATRAARKAMRSA